MKTNFKVGDVYKDLFWNYATGLTVQEFKTTMDEFKKEHIKIHDWLRAISP